MLRLDRTAFRIVSLHHDQDAEDRAHWETRTPEQRQEILDFLTQQAWVLQQLCNNNPQNLPNHELFD